MKLNNKAVSPLIATILLVVVAVVLVTIVLTWGKNFTTDSLNDVTSLTDDSCIDTIGTLSVSNCRIQADGNITFQLRNASNNYIYPASDVFTIDLINIGGDMDSGLLITDDALAPATWEGLSPGETTVVKVTPVETLASSNIEVTVKSQICPSDAHASATCR